MQSTLPDVSLDLIGIGIGPANLSLAALLARVPRIRSRFFDRRPEFQWHPGLMLPQASLQVHFLKDLVSLVDPTSDFSFLSFLSQQRRLLCFINANFPQVLRREFNQYYRWACERLPTLEFGCDIERVDVEGDRIVLRDASGSRQSTRHLVLATGHAPAVPACARPWLGPTLMHASQYLVHHQSVAGKRVIVVGGGQTGAEVFQHLISDTEAMPARISWVSRRWNFFPLDESSFTNELYTPGYSDYFYGLPQERRVQLLAEQKLASDGISTALLEEIYRRVYELRYVAHHPCDLQMRPGRELVEVERLNGAWRLDLVHEQSGGAEAIDADIVVLCTGYASGPPAFLAPIAGRIRMESGAFVVDHDYAIEWDGPPGCRIYVQNAAKHQRGIADPNLGLIPWRSARIINSVADCTVYDVDESTPFVHWGHQSSTLPFASRGLLHAVS